MGTNSIQTHKVASGLARLIKALDIEKMHSVDDASKMGYFSSDAVAERLGIVRSRMREILREKHVAGKIKRITVSRNGRRSYYYKV